MNTLFAYIVKAFFGKVFLERVGQFAGEKRYFCNFSKSWGVSSRLCPRGVEIALEQPPGEIFFQVGSLIGPDRQNNGTVFDMAPRPTYKQAY
jgi:hypothetical protein